MKVNTFRKFQEDQGNIEFCMNILVHEKHYQDIGQQSLAARVPSATAAFPDSFVSHCDLYANA